MAGMKGIMLAFALVLVAFHCTSSETLNENEDLKLQSMMLSSVQMDQAKSSLERRGYPNWKKHPLFPLYEVDFPVCEDAERERKFGLCKAWEKSGFCTKRRNMMERYCPRTCGMCKAFAAPACQKSRSGCCWDNSKKFFGPNGEQCPPCLDIYPTTCPQFKNYCFRDGQNALFVRYHCFKTCGRCAQYTRK